MWRSTKYLRPIASKNLDMLARPLPRLLSPIFASTVITVLCRFLFAQAQVPHFVVRKIIGEILISNSKHCVFETLSCVLKILKWYVWRL